MSTEIATPADARKGDSNLFVSPENKSSDLMELRKLTREWASSNPMLQRFYTNATAAGANWRIVTPADAIGERNALVAGMVLEPDKFTGSYVGDKKTGRYVDDLAAISSRVYTAPIFLWKNDIRAAALSMPLPDHIFGSSGWPYAIMWWTFEKKIGYTVDHKDGIGQLSVEGQLLEQDDDGVCIWTVFEDLNRTDRMLSLSAHEIKYGQRISQLEHSGEVQDVLKMVAFLNSKYVDSSSQRMHRADRRACLKADDPKSADETVRVVDLRAKQADTQKSVDGRERDWRGRWWVRGHIRAQWCPSTKSHRLIWIAPFLKGPEDKPILEKIYRVKR